MRPATLPGNGRAARRRLTGNGHRPVLSPGTGLAHPDDIARPHAQICGCQLSILTQ
ncbi:hypothetical protein NOVOSPHI9U_10093 [Novosphingobium sp. 9U]|nr:hypothetical protein NOVOSPHI9U_10093 [Novosphingobium sp. 9U]